MQPKRVVDASINWVDVDAVGVGDIVILEPINPEVHKAFFVRARSSVNKNDKDFWGISAIVVDSPLGIDERETRDYGTFLELFQCMRRTHKVFVMWHDKPIDKESGQAMCI